MDVTFNCSNLIAEKKYSLRMSFYGSPKVFNVSAIKRTSSLEHLLQVPSATNEKLLSNPTTSCPRIIRPSSTLKCLVCQHVSMPAHKCLCKWIICSQVCKSQLGSEHVVLEARPEVKVFRLYWCSVMMEVVVSGGQAEPAPTEVLYHCVIKDGPRRTYWRGQILICESCVWSTRVRYVHHL